MSGALTLVWYCPRHNRSRQVNAFLHYRLVYSKDSVSFEKAEHEEQWFTVAFTNAYAIPVPGGIHRPDLEEECIAGMTFLGVGYTSFKDRHRPAFAKSMILRAVAAGRLTL